ncbi:HIT domain-containing protein [Candidatus Saccharibacteria bacterium]|nr:HIT domain-containing protein [Candidatus Saccharibacteria bacterium]
MSSVFTKIINGEIPCYKIYEDDKVIAFLDIAPETKGHTLVVPKNEVDKIYDLPDEDFNALMQVAKKLSVHMEKVLGARTLWKVIGTDVPHTHVHLMPQSDTWQYGKTLELTPEEFEEIRQKLVYETE